MAIVTLTEQQRVRLAAQGYSPDNVRFLTASAQVLHSDSMSPVEQEFAARMADFVEQAKVPMVTEGRPTIMRVVAWMAHEGINRNRLAFRREHLEAAATKITPPYLLPMDFNHSAVDDWAWDEKVIGAWYKGEFALDPAVNKYGILATGMMWSWAFPRYADKLLAEQGRNGKIDFSMAGIMSSITKDADTDGPFEWGEHPTFMTLSALDVAPGDGAANGLAIEGDNSDGVEDELADKLKDPARRPPIHTFKKPTSPSGNAQARAAAAEFDPEAVLARLLELRAPAPTPPARAAVPTEDATMDELLAFLRENATKLANQDTIDALSAKVEDIAAKLAEQKDAAEQAATLAAQVTEMKGTLEERETALAAANDSLAKANATIEELNAAVKERDEKLATYREVEEKAAAEAQLKARLAQLPEAFLAAHNAKPAEKRTEIEASWSKKTDEEWAEVVELASTVPPVAKSYLRRSAEEGSLPTGGTEKTGAARLSQFLRR